MSNMKTECFIVNNDDVVGIVYFHESLGRMLVIRGNINPEYSIVFYSLDTNQEVKTDLKEYLLRTWIETNEQK